MYFIIYKITNKLNNKIYIGKHQTKDINDSYMGSGKYIKRAINKYGIENFTKEIIEFCKDKEEMDNKEKIIVNENFIKCNNNYNLKIGGEGGFDYINKNKLSNNKNFCNCIDENGNIIRVTTDDERWKSGKLVGMKHNRVMAKDENGNIIEVYKDDERWKSGKLVGMTKGYFCAIDKDRNKFFITKDDERYKTGLLIAESKNRKASEYSKQKRSEVNKNRIWISNIELRMTKFINKDDLQDYLDIGWIKKRLTF